MVIKSHWESSEYKLWRQQDYTFMYAINEPQIQEIRIG